MTVHTTDGLRPDARKRSRTLITSFDPGFNDTLSHYWHEDAEPFLGWPESVNQDTRTCSSAPPGYTDGEDDYNDLPEDQCEDEGAEEGLF